MRMTSFRAGSLVVVAAIVVATAGCGGGDSGGGDTGVAQASQACGEAFAAAAVAPSPGAAGEANDLGVDPGARNLLALTPTLKACDGFDDWMAGAKAHLDAVPRQMDPESALLDLCQSSGEKDAKPCADLVMPSSGDQ